MTAIRLVGLILGVVMLAAIGFAVFAWHPEIAPVEPATASSFLPDLVRRGAQLASIGNCNTCHTPANGPSFAGGLRIPTQFGSIYTTNITPDRDTGIGRWSEAAFARAMREGIDRQGRQLYPAFPYDHFTHVTDEDIEALYAYFMTRQPVRAEAPANELRFPLNYRFVIAGWKLLFFRRGLFEPDATHDAAWNRGAYLVEGLSHCGGCHTPRNGLGAERSNEPYNGGEAEGWTAYALNARSQSPVPWDRAALFYYLRHGFEEAHGTARGPMAPVIDNLGVLPDEDIMAIATYMADVAGEPSPQRKQHARAILDTTRKNLSERATADSATSKPFAATTSDGAAIYGATCAPCHESGRPLPYGGIDLTRSTGANGPTARNLINVVLWGLPPSNGQRSPIMPGFMNAMNDSQLEALASYVRKHFGTGPAWTGIDHEIRDARAGKFDVGIYPAPSSDPAFGVISEREAR
jgi:mono/diheme cytochrome c family protein